MLMIDVVLKLEIFKLFKLLHSENIDSIFVTLDVSKSKFKVFKFLQL